MCDIFTQMFTQHVRQTGDGKITYPSKIRWAIIIKTVVIIILSMILLIGMVGCGPAGGIEAPFMEYHARCINGMAYLEFNSGVTVAYTEDGKIKRCGGR